MSTALKEFQKDSPYADGVKIYCACDDDDPGPEIGLADARFEHGWKTADLLAETAPELITASAQARWAARSVEERLGPLRRLRLALAENPEQAIPALAHLPRSAADSLSAEVLPLLDAIRFLEQQAARLLAPRRLGRSGRPLWLTGVHSEVRRDPLGHVLVIGPSNFPLFLPATHALQALVAGNAVTWKPGAGGLAAAQLVANLLREAGLPRGILRITGESVEEARAALADAPDKVVFTGSLTAGRHILAALADSATPAVMELSGNDAVVVLPSAERTPGLPLVARALALGMRLNGAQVCMSPRRLFATRGTLEQLKPLLLRELAAIPPVTLSPAVAMSLEGCLEQATAAGARLVESSAFTPAAQRPIVVDAVTPAMALAQSDLFAPVLSLIEIRSVLHAAGAVNTCAFALAATIFGAEAEAETLAASLRVGTVQINDLIAPTADPRIPFGGRGRSGFGVTRGAEGLLEMTAVKTVLVRRGGTMRHLDATTDAQVPLVGSLIRTLHAGSWGDRVRAIRELVTHAKHDKEAHNS